MNSPKLMYYFSIYIIQKVKAEVYVEGEPDIRVDDICTIKITLTRLNHVDENRDFAYVKSSRYPYNQMEKWYIIVAEEKRNIVLLPDIVNIFFIISL